MYLCIGRIIALSILHGVPGPTFSAPIVVDYLFGGFSAVQPCIEDVPDNELQLKVQCIYAHSNTCTKSFEATFYAPTACQYHQ